MVDAIVDLAPCSMQSPLCLDANAAFRSSVVCKTWLDDYQLRGNSECVSFLAVAKCSDAQKAQNAQMFRSSSSCTLPPRRRKYHLDMESFVNKDVELYLM